MVEGTFDYSGRVVRGLARHHLKSIVGVLVQALDRHALGKKAPDAHRASRRVVEASLADGAAL